MARVSASVPGTSSALVREPVCCMFIEVSSSHLEKSGSGTWGHAQMGGAIAGACEPRTSCAIRRVLYAAPSVGMLDCPMPRLSNVQQVTSGRPAESRRPARCATTGCAPACR